MDNPQTCCTGFGGLAFSIPDLMLVQAWAEANGMVMTVRLDLAQDYEEILAFQTARGQPNRYIMWNYESAVFVLPSAGPTQRYACIADAIEALTPRRRVAVTDVTPRQF